MTNSVDSSKVVQELKHDYSGKYLLFVVGQSVFGLPIMLVQELMGMELVEKIENKSHQICGKLSIESGHYDVWDLRSILGCENNFNAETSVIVINTSRSCAVVVDRVCEVVDFDFSDIAAVLPKETHELGLFKKKCVYGLAHFQSKRVVLLDIDKLLKSLKS